MTKRGKNKKEEKIAIEEKTADEADVAIIPHVGALITAAEDAITTEEDDDVVIAPADHEDHPSTYAFPNDGDEDDDEDDDEDEDTEPQLPDVGNDLSDDDEDDDDDDDFCIQGIPRELALKGISIQEPSSQEGKDIQLQGTSTPRTRAKE
ncbi:calsequestrin-1-like [Cynara cardunculus var. scolymus]|uniref:calsequestrin-1-like n=1 Tax=Cynara cardunculus var. scolymus TaxID=59895 RepID=UPI000D62D157|nr:calsequestrin-1-like [Cynara cardunculus var. scolymus]